MKNKNCHTVQTVAMLGTDTLLKSGGVKPVLGAQTLEMVDIHF